MGKEDEETLFRYVQCMWCFLMFGEHLFACKFVSFVESVNICTNRARNCAGYSRQCAQVFHVDNQILKISRQIGDYDAD